MRDIDDADLDTLAKALLTVSRARQMQPPDITFSKPRLFDALEAPDLIEGKWEIMNETIRQTWRNEADALKRAYAAIQDARKR